MKHFITFMTQQPSNSIRRMDYENTENNPRLEHDFKTSFPILIPMSNICTRDENVKLTVIITHDPQHYSEKNYEEFLNQLKECTDKIGFSCQIKVISVEFDENCEKQMRLFENIIEAIDENDVIVGDITFGNKPSPIVLLMALTYADHFCKNAFIDMLIYGGVSHGTETTSFINDVSSLFYMNSIINRMSILEPDDPMATIKKMING